MNIVITGADQGIGYYFTKQLLADPEKVGSGLAKHITSRRFIICHSPLQKIQTLVCYLFPIPMGRLMIKMTMRCTMKES